MATQENQNIQYQYMKCRISLRADPITNPLGLAIMKCSFLKGAGVTLSLTSYPGKGVTLSLTIDISIIDFCPSSILMSGCLVNAALQG
jgi:hypothetical protein